MELLEISLLAFVAVVSLSLLTALPKWVLIVGGVAGLIFVVLTLVGGNVIA